MTACSNKRGKAGRVITAALVGALSVGAPAVALATGGVDLLFATPDGAFTNKAEVTSAKFTQGATELQKNAEGVYAVTFEKNVPVILGEVKVKMLGASATADFTINAQDPNDDYEVAYYRRGADGKGTGDAITGDITEVGEYVAVITAAEGTYEGGVLYVPFDIDAKQITDVEIVDYANETYDAETHDYKFQFDGTDVYEGIDYDVYYVMTGHDATEANATEVKDAGKYVAVITGKGGYAGTVVLSDVITIEPLDLDDTNHVTVVGLSSASASEPEDPYAICIDGQWFSGDDAIISELKADLKATTDVWHENKEYMYTLGRASSDNENITKDTVDFKANKVAYELDFLYDGQAMPAEHDLIMNDSSTAWQKAKVTAQAADGTAGGITVKSADITETVYKSDGTKCADNTWKKTPGEYTVVYDYKSDDFKCGGVAMVKVTVYRQAVDADAQASVLYDANGDGVKEIVNSISAVYDGTDLKDDIEVYVENAAGTKIDASRYDVKYYDADGREVGEVVNAGTYTLRLTSSEYKLSGTTELTITVGKLDLSSVKSGAVQTKKFDQAGVSAVEYLPYSADGYSIDDLELVYGDDVDLPMDVVKVTILDESGEEVKKVTDEGVYTVRFEARNADAENNYVIPGDLTLTCVKDSHLHFVDVTYTDYFADAVDLVLGKGIMNGYQQWVSNPDGQGYYISTGVFGAQDTLTRGQVACVLYNMADIIGEVETDPTFDATQGYVTGFSDVDGHAYYAKAIAWAKMAGVVNGDEGTTSFRPDDEVTREEFAAMLANYERLFGDFQAAGGDALDSFGDAAQVSDWARESVAWAVESGIMGNGGAIAPASDITRADTACMIYNYVG